MIDHAPRCPFCACIVKLAPSFWERIGIRTARIHCPTCQRQCDARDARTMGDAFGHWADIFRGKIVAAVEKLPCLTEHAIHRALGMPPKEDTRLLSSVDELVRTCLRHQRSVVIEMARGREATLEVAYLNSESSHTPELVAVLGTSSAESGTRETQQLVARQTAAHFVLFTRPGKEGAELRVKRAVHEKQGSVYGMEFSPASAHDSAHGDAHQA